MSAHGIQGTVSALMLLLADLGVDMVKVRATNDCLTVVKTYQILYQILDRVTVDGRMTAFGKLCLETLCGITCDIDDHSRRLRLKAICDSSRVAFLITLVENLCAKRQPPRARFGAVFVLGDIVAVRTDSDPLLC